MGITTEEELKQKRQEASRRWRSKNIEKARTNYRNWARNNPEKKKASRQAWKLANPEKNKIYKKKQRLANPDKARRLDREWYAKNTFKVIVKNYAYQIKKIKSDPLFKFKRITRQLIRSGVKRAGHNKQSKTELILGCSFNEFKTYLTNKFTNGMTWLNHGEWHIDHIIPVHGAKTIEEAIKLNHCTNFQPLWATTKIAEKYGELNYIGNLEKGAK